MNISSQITALGGTFAKHKNLTHWRVSFLVRGDGQFLSRLMDGKSCTVKTAEAAIQWFSDNWPADLEWPADLPRPAPTASPEKEAGMRSRAIAMTRGSKVLARRKALGLTQKQLSDYSGASATSICALERGQYHLSAAEWERKTALYNNLMTVLWGTGVASPQRIRTPEAASDDDLYETASGTCAGSAAPSPLAPPAPFDAPRAAPFWGLWPSPLAFIGDVVGVLCLFATLFAGIWIGSALL